MLGQHQGAEFRKSSHSDPDNCVFVARPATGTVAVKDGKDPQGPALEFDRPQWAAFVEWTGRHA
ncbi:DUF397 domain-containing protein [Streptomyces sp. NPDC056491]|uniref:DUF397 domain-containing protein n=1 Tax=Streptomyces sp. NPDC056491 TaxID=3345837 RepID=UPI0036A2F9BA